jgi:hypothetical protein
MTTYNALPCMAHVMCVIGYNSCVDHIKDLAIHKC